MIIDWAEPTLGTESEALQGKLHDLSGSVL